MKKVYIAKCNTPLICHESFEKAVQSYPQTIYVSSDTYLIYTDDDLDTVKQKFQNQTPECNSTVELALAGDERTKDFTISIMG